MSLRRKTLLIIGVTLIWFFVLLYISARNIILESFVQVEDDNAKQNMQRALDMMSSEIDSLASMTEDWASWDDTYEFIQDGNSQYIESNLVDSTFIANRLNIMVFIDRDKQVVYSKGFNLYDEQQVLLEEELNQILSSDNLLVQNPDIPLKVSGIMMLPEGPALIASLPVLTSEDKGPVQGTLIFGRYLDRTEVQRLSKILHLRLTVQAFDDSQLTPDIKTARSHLSDQPDIYIQAMTDQAIAAYGVLKDVYGAPALILKIDMPRDVYEQGQVAIRYFMLALIVTDATFGFIMVLLLEQAVLSRLARLSKDVNQIKTTEDVSNRVSLDGNDELSGLANAINGMLTNLERSQRIIRNREQRLRSIVSNSPVILYTLNQDGIFTLLEGRGLRDIDPKEFIGRPISDLFGQTLEILEYERHGLADEVFLAAIPRSGQIFEVHHILRESDDSEADNTIGVATDITRRKQAEDAEHRQRLMAEALRDTAATLASTLNLDEVLDHILKNIGQVVAHDAAYIMLVEGGVTSVVRSQGYAEHDREDWIGNLHCSVADVPALQQVLDSGRPLIVQDTHTFPDWPGFPGTAWIRSCVCVPIRLERQVIGLLTLDSALPGVFTQEHAEWLQMFADQAALAMHNAQLYEAERRERLLAQTLRRTAEALGASIQLEKTLKIIIEQLGQVVRYDGVIVMLVEGDLLRVVGADGMLDQERIRNMTFRYPDSPLIREAMLSETPIVLEDARSDPRWTPLPGFESLPRAWIGAPLTAQEIVIGFLSVASSQPSLYTQRDAEAISAFAQQAALAVENARILTELESALNELQEAQIHLLRTGRLSAAGQLAAGVAHQINNPLTTVVAEAHLLAQELDPADPNLESVTAIAEAAKRAGTVVQRLLDLARTHPYTMQPLDINASLQDTISLARAQIVPHIARLDVDLAPDLPLVSASTQHLEDVWINLLINARDAVSEQKDGIIKVASRLTTGGDAIEVIVQDNGPGIGEENIKRIFDPFFTTKEYGTGLGLSICQEVVARHRGTIRVDSKKGQGTTFTVTLPVTGHADLAHTSNNQ